MKFYGVVAQPLPHNSDVAGSTETPWYEVTLAARGEEERGTHGLALRDKAVGYLGDGGAIVTPRTAVVSEAGDCNRVPGLANSD